MADVTTPPATDAGALFERKIRLSRWAQLVRAAVAADLWRCSAVGALFLIVSLAGLWPRLPEPPHGLLGVFVAAVLAALVWMVRTPLPARDEALRRIERRSAVPHRPASSYEDTLTARRRPPARRKAVAGPSRTARRARSPSCASAARRRAPIATIPSRCARCC